MLQRQTFQEARQDEDAGEFLSPAYLYDILKRRALYFAIPFLVVLAIGSLVALAWPAKYVAQGKILVASQQIPSDLVRPTVATLANERMQVIEQRIMTRDNLIEIAKKYSLSTGWRERMSGTEIVDFIRNRTKIKPLELNLQNQRKDAIAFTVGFEYEQPRIAMRVANEIVTMILNEDARSRTNYAAETTRFLQADVQRIEAKLSSIDAQISKLKITNPRALTVTSQLDDAKELAALRAQLLLKSATYSDTHPDIKLLKRKIEALESGHAPKNKNRGAEADAKIDTTQHAAAAANASEIDTLETRRLSLKSELTNATQKLAAARLGESLERGQHSERLEVIEQPTLPRKPVSPNRPKIFGFAFALALMAGGGLVFAAEMLNPAIRRSTDLFSVIDSHLVVSIPYISTIGEVRRKKRTAILALGILIAIVIAGIAIVIFFLPPLDILFAKVIGILLR
jgi:uncharacterized protein involved in exopolysaccharide biosynthesis